jgi:DNA-binding CsgD family transcriptional regulator/tetratricopeptide (TPR) repeat protein
LRATLDWSFELLTEPERVLLQRLSVFAGDFSLEAAEAVGAEDVGADDVGAEETRAEDREASGQARPSPVAPRPSPLDILGRLVARSLVQAEEQPAGARAELRYRLLETVREYARERLDEAGDVEMSRRRHARWCVALAEQAEPLLLGAEQLAWLARLDDEYVNIRAALGWCLEHDPPLGLRLAACLWQFWRVRLYLAEGRHWLERLLARTPEPSPVRARALVAAGTLADWQFDPGVARDRYAAGLDLARALCDRRLVGETLRLLGSLTAFRFGDHRQALALFAEGLELSRAVGDRRCVGINLMQQGRLATAEGEYRRARALLDESVTILSGVGDRWQLAIALEDAGSVALVMGQPDRATALFEEALAAARAIETAGLGRIHRRFHLGSVAYWRGDTETAVAWYEDGLAMTRESDHIAGIADNLAGLGRAVLLQGDVPRATGLLRESLQMSIDRADSGRTGQALYGLGLAAWAAGDGALAVAHLRESLALRRGMHERLGIAECLEALALVTAGRAEGSSEDARRALRWLGAADALREQIGAPRPPVEQPGYDSARKAAGRRLDDAGQRPVDAADAPPGEPPLDAIVADALSDGPRPDAAAGPPAPAPPAPASAPDEGPPAMTGGLPAGLSVREAEVLRLIAAGRTNPEIAHVLVISINTVRHHVTHILDKTGCENRAAVVAFALRHRLA